MRTNTARLARAFSLSVALLVCAHSAAAQTANYGDYRLVSDGTTTTICHEARQKCWQGYIATPPGRLMPPGAVAHRLQFTFRSENYFRNGNTGHFAIGVRGDAVSDADGDGRTDIRGAGIILGNVSQYRNRGKGCEAPWFAGDRAAVETFWTGGNCVYGASTATQEGLRDNVDYLVTLESRDTKSGEAGRLVRYRIQRTLQGLTIPVGEGAVVDSLSPLKGNLGGLFILEVFSGRPWEVQIKGLTETFD